METAKENPICSVGLPLVALPLFDVVGLSHVSADRAPRPETSAVSGGESDALTGTE